MRGPHLGDDAKGGLGARREAADLAKVVHAHLEHEHLRIRRGRQDGERQPDEVVVVARRGVHTVALGKARRQDVLGRGLADRSGHADDRAAQAGAIALGKAQQELGGVIAGKDGAPTLAGHGDDLVLRVARHHDRARAQLDRLEREVVAVHALAGKGHEDGVRLDGARVDGHAPAHAVGVPAARRAPVVLSRYLTAISTI